MNKRQRDILAFVINEYIKSAQPVGSALLAAESGMNLSSATYRNELAALEKEGYLSQPYTSAGRVPTEQAYQYYVNEFLDERSIRATSAKELKLTIRKELETESALKNVAKQLVEFSDHAVILAFDKDNVYYTGLTNLLSKPEFASQDRVVSITEVVDHLDEVIDAVFDKIDDLEIRIGSHNPFGAQCSSILGKYRLKKGAEGMFAILGPMRMDYKKNMQLMEGVKLLVEKL